MTMTYKHIPWTSIESLFNVRRTIQKYPELLQGNSVVTYQAKVKLHGTNAGIMINHDRSVVPISRTSVLSVSNDNIGFAKWLSSREEQFKKFAPLTGSVVIFGEWCGPGIQKGVAVNTVPEKVFAAFAIRCVDTHLETDFIDEPEAIRVFLENVPGAYAIDWFADVKQFELDFANSPESLQPVLDEINEHVSQVEKCDPWVKSVFGVEGVGEGLVFYPVSHEGYKAYSDLCFKAKGDLHKVVAKTKPVQADPTVTASLEAFADLVVTENRLEQWARGSDNNNVDFDIKNIGTFLKQFNIDINKETQAELEVSGLDKKLALKLCSDRARDWYVSKAKRL